MNKSQKGNAYIMVIMVALVILMLASVSLIITASSRRMTARYRYFTGLYDLAVAGNEQALFLLRQGVDTNRELIRELVQDRVFEDLDSNIVYYNRQFQVMARDIFIEEAAPFAIANLQAYFSPYGLNYRRIWGMNVGFVMPGGYIVEDRYQAATIVSTGGQRFAVNTSIIKYTNEVRSHPALVEAGIVWFFGNCDCMFLPKFAWRYIPEYFIIAAYQNANIGSIVDLSLLHILEYAAEYENALMIITDDDAHLDISGITSPVVIIHTSNSLRITTNDTSNTNLYGIIVSQGDVAFYNVNFTGNVWAAGEIDTNVGISPHLNAIFDIQLSAHIQQYFFDFLRISNFSGSSNFAEISSVLGHLKFSDDNILINCLDDYTLTMVELMRAAN